MMAYWGRAACLMIAVWVAAAARAAPEQPVIVVPGIVGSRLCEDKANGKQLWGAGLFYLGRMGRLRLPVAAGETAAPVRPCGLLDSFGVLGPFDVDVYKGLIDFLKSTGYREGADLFVFDYDWRQSNFDTAALLRAKVAEVKARTGKAQVAIVAHSMGGIVSRVYLQSLGGAADVKTMVFFGTPHQGAPQVLRTANEGWGTLPNWIVGGSGVIRDTLFSWPSVYELLALETCCAVSRGPADTERFGLTSPRSWARFAWFPDRYKSAEGQAFLDRVLAQSRRMRALLDAPLPAGPAYELIASRAHKTAETAVFNGSYTTVRFAEGAGDESVPILSAANGAIALAKLVPQKHTGLYDDPYAHYLLAQLLNLDAPALFAKYGSGSGGRVLRVDRTSGAERACTDAPPALRDATVPGGVQAVLKDDAGQTVCIWAFRIEAPRAVPAGAQMEVTLTLGGYTAAFWRALTPTVSVTGDDGVKAAEHAPVSAFTGNAEERFAAVYRFRFAAPAKPGVYRLDLTQDGLADKSASVYVIVYGPEGASAE